MNIEVGAGLAGATQKRQGQPLVLLHSLLAGRDSFNEVAGPLSRHFRVIVLDLPGFGVSPPAAGGLEGLAHRIAGTIAEVLPGERPVVLGNGLGAFVALQAAILYPGLASRLVLAGCGAAFDEPGRAAFRAMARAAQDKGLGAIADIAMKRLFSLEFQAAHPGLMAERRAGFLRTNPAVFQAACDALAALDLREAAGRVRIPALVLAGEQDEATPPPMARELAALLPDARLEILAGCAHVPQLQMPDAFLAASSAFMMAPAA